MKKLLSFAIAAMLALPIFAGEPAKLSGGKVLTVRIDEQVIGKPKKGGKVGRLVACSIVADVSASDGSSAIAAGTPAVCTIASLKKPKAAGVKGRMTIDVTETTMVDGQTVKLFGSLDSDGRGNTALAATGAALIAAPMIFIKGKAAKIESGTLFEARVVHDTELYANGQS